MNNSPLRRDFRHTKIVCTLGPASKEYDVLSRMAKAGMNIARFNMSHGTHATHEELIQKIKKLSSELNHPIAMLLDLQGPEIRTAIIEQPLILNAGEIVWVSVAEPTQTAEKTIFVNYAYLVTDLKVGDRVTIDNGIINLEVLETTGETLRCRVLDGGKLGSRRHVNLPGISVKLPSITERDKEDIAFGLQHGFDYIALSFVRAPEDVLEVKRMVEAAGATTRVLAKIETQEAVNNFDAILEVSDGIMVARGDLGVEVEIRELPVIQRRIVRACAIAGKPVIVATHLLESMIVNPLPTRAEVTDVANAVYEEADALMLSGETGAGVDPVRCVQVMDEIARRIEKERGLGFSHERRPRVLREELARSACRTADSLGAHAIVVISKRGLFAELVASFRPERAIIYAFTDSSVVRQRLWLYRSVVPMLTELHSDPETTVRNALGILRGRNRLLAGDPVVVVSDVVALHERVTSIQVRIFD